MKVLPRHSHKIANKNKTLHYKVFIEPKDTHLKTSDAWKESFLTSLKKEHKLEQLWENRKYIVWGMPFYNKNEEIAFDTSFKEELTL